MSACIGVALWGLVARARPNPKRLLHLIDLSMIVLIAVMFYLSRHDMPGHLSHEDCVAPATTATKTMLWGLYLVSAGLQ